MKPPASLARHADAAQQALSGDDGALVKLRTLKAALAWVVTLIPTAGPGVSQRRSLNGDVWSALLGGGGGSVDNLTVAADGTVKAGTIGGVMPEIGGDRIDGSYTPLVIGSGTVHVVVTIDGTLTSSGGFVESLILTSNDVTIDVESDPGPAGLVSNTGEFKVLLATFSDGEKTYQRQGGDWNLDVCDDRSGAGSCSLVIFT